VNSPRVDYDFQDWVRAAYSGDWGRIKNAQTESVGADGAFTVPVPLAAELIDLVRHKTQVIAAGAQMIPMSSKTLSFAKQESDPSAYWRGELVPITPSKATFSMVNMTAHTVGAIVPCSEEVLMESINLGVILQEALGKALALKLDLACLIGNGVVGPLGIANTPGVQTVSAVGTLSTIGTRYTPFSQAWGKLLAANFEPTVVLYNALTAAKIDDLKDMEDRPLLPPNSWSSFSKLVTN
jgi:HK97 family phage major capsid protein